MAETAYAYVTLIPVAKGFKSAISKELSGANGVAANAGSTAGGGFKNGFNGAIKGLFKAAAIGAGVAATSIGGVLASGFQRLSGIEEAQAKLAGLGNSADDVAVIMDNALSSVRGTAFGMADAATISASAVAAGVKPGEELAQYLKTIADTSYIAGAGLGEMGTILNKATTSGKATNEILGQLAERGIPIYQMLGDAAGVAAGEIFDMASEGEISSQMLMTALSDNLGGAALKSGDTVTGAFANMRAAIQRVGANFLAPSFGFFKDFFLGIIDLLGPVEEKAKVWGEAFAGALQEVRRYMGLFQSGAMDMGMIFQDISGKIQSWLNDGGLTKFFEKGLEMREALFNAIATALPAIIDALTELIPKVISFFTDQLLPMVLGSFVMIVDELSQLIVDLLPNIVGALLELIPGILEAAIDVFDSLVEAVVEITPMLIDTIVDLLPDLITAIVDMLPSIVDAAVDLFTGLVDGLVEVIPVLLDGIINAIPQITRALLDALPQIIEAAFDLFTGIINGLVDATPDIIAAIIDLIPEIVTALMDAIPQLVEAGIQLVTGLAKGIIDNAPRILGNAIRTAGETLVNGVKDFLGIRSPSLVMFGIGKFIPEGLANGIESKTEVVAEAAKKMGEVAVAAVDDTVANIEEKFTVISSIPGVLSTAMEETVKISMAQVRRMAESTAGIFAEFNQAGDLVRSYSGYGNDPLTDAFNSVLKYQDRTSISQIEEAAQQLFGGTMQQVRDAINPNPQATLINPATGMQRTIGAADADSLARAIERATAEGFSQRLEPIATPIEELNKTIEDLIDTVSEQGLTPFATGGFVTGPTPALIGEAGPEVVMPLDRFERAIGLGDGKSKTVNYYAAPNQSLDNEQALFQAMRRAKVVANW